MKNNILSRKTALTFSPIFLDIHTDQIINLTTKNLSKDIIEKVFLQLNFNGIQSAVSIFLGISLISISFYILVLQVKGRVCQVFA